MQIIIHPNKVDYDRKAVAKALAAAALSAVKPSSARPPAALSKPNEATP